MERELEMVYGDGAVYTADAGLVIAGSRFAAWIRLPSGPTHAVDVTIGSGGSFVWRETPRWRAGEPA